MNILTVNLVFSTLIFWIMAQIYLLPRLDELSPRSVLIPIMLLHAMRHLGLMFLSQGAVFPGLAPAFATPAAIGDFIAALLALVCLLALVRGWAITGVLLWVFSIEGFLDLMLAIVLATIHDAHASMGPAYWIPAFWVPALLVTHVIVVIILLRHGTRLGEGRRV